MYACSCKVSNICVRNLLRVYKGSIVNKEQFSNESFVDPFIGAKTSKVEKSAVAFGVYMDTLFENVECKC